MTGAELGVILDELNWTQKQLADFLRVTPLTPMRWLQGVHPIPHATAMYIRLVQGRRVALADLEAIRNLWEGD